MASSAFDLFKIGIGPSSSHTMGPMVAAARFLSELRVAGLQPEALSCSLHGSLAFTGKGHGTDRAVALGLGGFDPSTVDAEEAEQFITELRSRCSLTPPGLPPCKFDLDSDLHFDYGPALPGHPNGLRLFALDGSGVVVADATYYSIGGGFVLREGESADTRMSEDLPYPFTSAGEMLTMGRESGLTIVEMGRANESTRRDSTEINQGLDEIWQAMSSCIDRGLNKTGELPGALKVRRRAAAMLKDLVQEAGRNDIPPHRVNDWLAVYAMAVNEENAAGGRIVTAPTNGAAGVLPSVIRYYLGHCPSAVPPVWRDMLLAAAAVGSIIKRNASISGAEVGCQGEVGSASAMAAAALCAAMGGSNEQVENAAEIALEHHLGMTCDPIGGLVQIPCIERNGLGAVKAVTAASLALHGDGQHHVSLDQCIETMRQTGADMLDKYKETSQGGLAVNVVAC